MDIGEARLECLKLATASDLPPDMIVAQAKAYLDFLKTGGEPAKKPVKAVPAKKPAARRK